MKIESLIAVQIKNNSRRSVLRRRDVWAASFLSSTKRSELEISYALESCLQTTKTMLNSLSKAQPKQTRYQIKDINKK